MTNTVTDAGTDAKIAKFGKRGIEIIGLGILDAVPATQRNTRTVRAPSHRGSVEQIVLEAAVHRNAFLVDLAPPKRAATPHRVHSNSPILPAVDPDPEYSNGK
ncbi:hypothetical protein FRC00_012622 [Tulasnella sp. 408]|nr:hypothetical protein FRC00_012622 [Tulasnella sp. 408]